MIEKGLRFQQEMTVEEKDTAIAQGSGNLPVFATPAMVAFMENTAVKCIEKELETGEDSVGMEINVRHLKATKVGGRLKAEAEVTAREECLIAFVVKVYDKDEIVGYADHKRFLINPERFMQKLS